MSHLRPDTDAQRAVAMERSISSALRESLAADAEREEAASAEREAQCRRWLPSQDSSRYGRGGGRAFYRGHVSQPPVEVVRAVPALRELYEAWQAENARGAELGAELRDAEVAQAALFDGRDADGNIRRRPGVSIDDVDASEQRVREAAAPIGRQEARALAALKAFDDAAHEPEVRTVRERIMAPVALAAHERLKAAWAELQDAAAARAAAFSGAGAPGLQWERKVYGPLTATRQAAEGYYEAMIDGFDVRALEAISEKDNA